MTPAKQRMIEGNRSDTEIVFRALIELSTSVALTREQISEALLALSGGGFDADVDERQVSKLLLKHCNQFRKIRLGGRGAKQVRPWILKPGSDPTLEEIRASVNSFDPSSYTVGDGD